MNPSADLPRNLLGLALCLCVSVVNLSSFPFLCRSFPCLSVFAPPKKSMWAKVGQGGLRRFLARLSGRNCADLTIPARLRPDRPMSPPALARLRQNKPTAVPVHLGSRLRLVVPVVFQKIRSHVLCGSWLESSFPMPPIHYSNTPILRRSISSNGFHGFIIVVFNACSRSSSLFGLPTPTP